MNRMSLKDIGLAGVSGLMLTASFAPIHLHWLAWIAIVPLLISVTDKSQLDALRLGLLAGLSHYLTLTYWITVVLSHYGNINIILSVAVLLLLSLYLALYIGVFALTYAALRDGLLSSFWAAGLWVALEYTRAHIMTGFPWCLLGYSQYSTLPLIQIADISGVYGISFIIVLVNLALYRVCLARDAKVRKSTAIEIMLPALLIGCILVYGFRRLTGPTEGDLTGKGLRAVIVQGNIDQSIKWNSDFQEKTVALYKELSRKSLDFKPQIIIWPETAVPFFFQDRSYLSREVFNTATTTNSKILFGSPAYAKDNDTILYYNRAYIVSESRVLDCYDKVHLVPFGEYVPLRRYLPFVHRLVAAAGDFSPGKAVRPLNAQGLKVGVLICFEVIFPDISRKHALEGAELFVNITNDAWFGRTSAPYQHLSMAVFRCIENALPMARAANTGISAFIRSNGQIVRSSGLFVQQLLKGEIKPARKTTFYSHRGDIFAILLLGLTIIRFFWKAIEKRRWDYVLRRDNGENRFPQ